MKKIYFFSYFFFLFLNASFGQAGMWTWISGTDTSRTSGNFGIKGVPSVNNHPPGLYETCEWKDKQGNFWIYGGTYPHMGDLWRFNPVTLEWTWMTGNGLAIQPPVYGFQGLPDPLNSPGTRSYCTTSWVDTAGNLWLFGGYNVYDNYVLTGSKNDLWKYDISINQWTWVNGPNTFNDLGVYGTQGVPGPYNLPRARTEAASSWTDASNNLWMYGGYAADSTGNLDDVWKYDIANNEWTWMKGANTLNASPNYGVKGVPAMSNDPGGRFTYSKLKDLKGNFWTLCGAGGPVSLLGPTDQHNDVWKFNPNTNEWTWMNGPNVPNDTGYYLTSCVFDSLPRPMARNENRAAVADNAGRFWMFGGLPLLSDLWVFDPQQLKWNLVKGNNKTNDLGSYGTKGVPSPANIPPSRFGANAWWGNDNKFYLFGGQRNDFITEVTFADVWVFTPDTNCIPLVTAIPPVANFQANQTVICTNDCIHYTDLSTNATSWSWTFQGANPATSSDKNPQNICYQTAGQYSVTLVASNAVGRDSITFTNYIKVNPTPPNPVITQHHDTLVSTTNPIYTSYQWYDGNSLIPGASDTILIITHGGQYNLQVVSENGCGIAVGITVGVKEFSAANYISLFPNPATNQLTIYTSSYHNGSIVILIMNVLGEIVQEEKLKWNSHIDLTIRNLSSGIYFLQMRSEGGSVTKKFVKE